MTVSNMSQGLRDLRRTLDVLTEIEQERLRQINQERFTPAHDDAYVGPDLLRGALIYASRSTWSDEDNRAALPEGFPWEREWWKPGLPRRMLIKAAALIVAHIEVLDRRAERDAAQVEAYPEIEIEREIG